MRHKCLIRETNHAAWEGFTVDSQLLIFLRCSACLQVLEEKKFCALIPLLLCVLRGWVVWGRLEIQPSVLCFTGCYEAQVPWTGNGPCGLGRGGGVLSIGFAVLATRSALGVGGEYVRRGGCNRVTGGNGFARHTSREFDSSGVVSPSFRSGLTGYSALWAVFLLAVLRRKRLLRETDCADWGLGWFCRTCSAAIADPYIGGEMVGEGWSVTELRAETASRCSRAGSSTHSESFP